MTNVTTKVVVRLIGARKLQNVMAVTIEELESSFVVKDAGGQKLGHFYFEEERGRRSWQAAQ